MSSDSFGLQTNYERLPWYKKPKNWIFPSFGISLVLILVFSTTVEEYHKEVEKHNDVIAAQIECQRNPPKSAHNRQSCWEANLKASRSPYVVALSNTGIRIFDGLVHAIQALGKSYLFTALVAVFSAMLVLYCISASPKMQGGAMLFHHGFDQFNPYLMLQQKLHQNQQQSHYCGRTSADEPINPNTSFHDRTNRDVVLSPHVKNE